MRSIRLLNLRRLTEQPVRALLAVLAIAAGTTLLVGVLIDQASLNQSFSKFVSQRAGAAKLEVHGPGGPAGLDERVLAKVEAVNGVKAAAPIVQVVTIARTAKGDERLIAAFGVDCRVEAILGRFGCSQRLTGLANAFAVSSRLATWLGEEGAVRTDVGRVPIANGLPVTQLDGLNNGNVAVFPLKDAQRLFGHEHALTSILVVPKAGVDVDNLRHDLAAVIGRQNLVDPPGSIGGTDFAVVLISMLMLVSLFGLAIGAQLVHNTVALTLEERRRDLAVVGAIGASRRVIFVGTLVECAVLGLLGGLLGVVGGVLVAHPLVDNMSSTIDDVTGLQLSVHVSAFAIAVGALLGIATSVVAAIGPARRASRMDVAAELQGQARGDETRNAARGRRAVVYAGLALVGLVMTFIGHRGGAIETWQPMCAMAGFGLTAFMALRSAQHGAAPLVGLVARIPGLRNGTARVAITNLAGEPKRTGVMVMALAAAVATGVVLGGLNASIVAGSRQFGDSLANDTLFAETLSANNSLGIAAKPSPAVAKALAAFPGVARVTESQGFCGEHPSVGSFCAWTGDPGQALLTIYRGRRSAAAAFAHGEVLIGAAMARSENLRPGDTFELPGRGGMRTVKVGAIWGDPNNAGRSVTLPLAAFTELYGARPPTELRITPAAGVSITTLERRLEVAHLDPDLKIQNGRELAADLEKSIKAFVTPFNALQRGMLIVALVAVTSTLLLVGVQRRREHGLLLAVGMAPSGLGRMVLTEAGIVGILASVVGTIAGAVTYLAMVWVAPLLSGSEAPFHFDLTAPVVYGGIGLSFVILGAALPAWRTSRLDPAIALRYE